jgi:hypothetical protein
MRSRVPRTPSRQATPTPTRDAPELKSPRSSIPQRVTRSMAKRQRQEAEADAQQDEEIEIPPKKANKGTKKAAVKSGKRR